MNGLQADRLSRRYGKRWALRDCSVEVPRGRISALVGPNGAGKTTLLHLAAGLIDPTEGTIEVLGETPRRNNALMPRVGFVAQDVPLYRHFTVAEMVRFGGAMNPHWDADFARRRLEQVDIPPGQRVGRLSGGQRAQVSLILALAKRPAILLLDEPLASLDPLARREFLQTLLDSSVESDLTVVLSSHLIADLERVCNHLIVLGAGRTQVSGDIDDLLGCHRVLTGHRGDEPSMNGNAWVVQKSSTDRQTTLIVRSHQPILDTRWTVDEIGLEELVIAYLGSDRGASGATTERTGVEVLR